MGKSQRFVNSRLAIPQVAAGQGSNFAPLLSCHCFKKWFLIEERKGQGNLFEHRTIKNGSSRQLEKRVRKKLSAGGNLVNEFSIAVGAKDAVRSAYILDRQ
jgi:hypothetical protein